MKTLSNLETALMGLLCEKAMHPYEIEKTIEARGMRDWTEISMSSVYKLLRSLEKDGLARSSMRISTGHRAQKVYEVTPAGREAMRAKVKQLISAWSKPIWPVDLALSNLDLLSAEEASEALGAYIQDLDKMIKCYGELKAYLAEHCPLKNQQMAERPLRLMEAEKDWANEFRRQYAKSLKRAPKKR